MFRSKHYRKNIAESKARIETEMRAAVAKLTHRPVAEIVMHLRERGIAADPAFVTEIAAKRA